MANASSETNTKLPKRRTPKSGKRITVTLSDEHYQRIVTAAAADDREPNVYLSRIVRQHLDASMKD